VLNKLLLDRGETKIVKTEEELNKDAVYRRFYLHFAENMPRRKLLKGLETSKYET
jgi:hypothetical protein